MFFPDTPTPEAGLRLCPRGWGRLSTLAMLSSLQYYEMSYGLNIEMHKQVTGLGTGVCGKGQSTSVGAEVIFEHLWKPQRAVPRPGEEILILQQKVFSASRDSGLSRNSRGMECPPWRRAWAVGQGSLGGNFPSSRDSIAEPNFCNCMIDPQEHVVDPGNL